MPTTFQRNKTNLIIATLATGLGVHLASLAQAPADQGSLIINGQISASTCLLDMGDAGSTGGGSKTLNLGNYTPLVGGTSAAGTAFGTAQTVVFSIKSPDGSGSACTLGSGNSRWDIGINIPSAEISSTGLLLSGGTAANVAQNVGVLLKTSFGPTATAGTTNLVLTAGSPTYGVLLSSSSASAPQAAATDKIALTAQFAKTTALQPTAGVFSATIPLNVYYK
jgi:hypothetical protein